jgi:hypothetical protein
MANRLREEARLAAPDRNWRYFAAAEGAAWVAGKAVRCPRRR